MGFETAVILSAGLGTRMRPLTETTPKPLLPLGGRPLLAHTLERLREAGVTRIIVNAHYLAAQIEDFLRPYPGVVVTQEDELQDTGGAITAMRAKGLLPEAPFYVINGDTYWVDGPTPTLSRLAKNFSAAGTDVLLLLARTAGAVADTGLGDFTWPRDGALRRRGERDVAPYLYAGVQLVSPALFNTAPRAPHSMNLLWDQAIAAGRLDAIVHDGLWFHLSTPADLASAEAVLNARAVGNTT
ncbi:nucleotidyltransferase family protein [Acidocella sp.]|uniref:nucleotidyltransferase family protein n=1 Tax=Acidocella sp. TaxID=50710 RepID=UPI00261CA71C|nr:nucleotidyltransferase family protein [Acidocella sp.]